MRDFAEDIDGGGVSVRLGFADLGGLGVDCDWHWDFWVDWLSPSFFRFVVLGVEERGELERNSRVIFGDRYPADIQGSSNVSCIL